MPPTSSWKVKNIAMIPTSTVAIRVFLNIAILQKIGGAIRGRRSCKPHGLVARAGIGRIIQAKQDISSGNRADFAALICPIEK
ncbi:hypothetical protein [Achromobacter sp. UMC71]|uniref:hypothetical protein n=1 Tax=Achromobacter sp. UMC71 TaxID=1862320 RepID=UPI0016041266|nr:hypothetical protein [Achromobacter sp. UMC71]